MTTTSVEGTRLWLRRAAAWRTVLSCGALLALAACSPSPTTSGSASPLPATPSATASATTAPPPAWRVVSSVDPLTNGHGTASFSSVACATSADCWAVGSTRVDDIIGGKTLAEHWDGAAWRVVASQDQGGGGDGFSGVACAGPTECWAVGGGGPTLAERWDGTAWSIVPTPTVGDSASLNAVTCVGAADCWAVGAASHGGVQGVRPTVMAEHWNGSAWTAADPPAPASDTNATLSGVSCLATSDCWAVGEIDNGNGLHSLAEHWDGTAWTVVATPNPTPYDSALSAVACASARDCWAVGTQTSLVVHWDGQAWSVVTSSSMVYTRGVACASSHDCWITGRTPSAGYSAPATEHWVGTAWQAVDTPSPPTPTATLPPTGANPPRYELDVVTCVAAADCWAVGSQPLGPSDLAPLVEHLATP